MSAQVEAFMPLLLNKKQAAFLLSTSIWGVEQLARQGVLIPYEGDGKNTKYKTEDVLRYVKNLKEKAS